MRISTPSTPFHRIALHVGVVLCSTMFYGPNAQCATSNEAPNTLSEKELADGWILLFDGQTMTGWEAANQANWKIDNGIISATEGDVGLLHTTNQFGDYLLKIDFRAARATNSGIFLRTLPKPKRPGSDCYELNIAPPDNRFPTGSFVRQKKADETDETDSWRTFEVTAQGNYFLIKLDGITVLEYTDPKPLSSGHIGLQFNRGKIEFRNVKLKPLSADFSWPGWLGGPGRDGWVDVFQPPTPWPEQPVRNWQVEVGTGYASPLVSGGHVYQHARQGDDEVVWCLDLKTGVVKWRKSYAAPFKMGGGAEHHGKGPKSSPALAEGRLFTLSITGVLSAWDMDSGELLWRCDYGSRFKKSHPRWGASTSPLIDGHRVIVHFGTDGQGALVAVDAKNGEEVWSSGNDGPSYSSPILVEIQGSRQVVEWNERALVGVDSTTGRPLWEYPYPQDYTDQNMPTPVYHRGLILLGGENRGVRGLELQLDRGIWTVRQQWHQEKVALDMSSAVINDDLLYGFSHYDHGRIFCLDPKTGEVLWQGPGRTGENVAFLATHGHIVALINNGELQILSAQGDHFERTMTYRVAEDNIYSTWAPPVLLDGGILVKDKQTLTRWSFDGS
ncbi:MAG: family 16 glycoside hydrolase [Pirellulales bacterium]